MGGKFGESNHTVLKRNKAESLVQENIEELCANTTEPSPYVQCLAKVQRKQK